MEKIKTKPYRKLKRTSLILLSLIVIITVALVLFISPLTKYLIEKYDEQFVGRNITMDWVYANPLTGYIHLSNVKIQEANSDSIFFYAKGISVNFAMLKLFYKTYEITKLTINNPKGIIIQNEKNFNFNDLIEKFSSKEDTDSTKSPVQFNLLNVKIAEGEFYYRDNLIPVNYYIKNVNIESEGIRWNVDSIITKFSFLAGMGSGDMKGEFTIDIKNMDYRLAVVANKYDLEFIGQYLKDLTNYGSFSANLDTDLKVKGNFNDKEDITSSGQLAINDFYFGKDPNDAYASFDKLALAINEISPKNMVYFYDSISLSRPYFKYERYDYLDNLQTMFGKGGDKISATIANEAKFNLVIEIANYIEVLSKNFFRSDYKINRFAIYDANIRFNDYSLSEKFSMELNPLTVTADSIDKKHDRVAVNLKSGIKPFGNLAVSLSINPRDTGDFDLQYNLKKLSLPMFNPYTISYTSFPLDKGSLAVHGKWKVRNGEINSDNHLIVIDPRVTSRVKNKNNNYVPVPLVLAFVKEGENVIDYEIPITGNLKDPKFHLKDVLFDLLENIFVKPPTMPYRMKVKNIEIEIENSFAFTWQTRQVLLFPDQQKFLKKMAEFLLENPTEILSVSPVQYDLKEKEYILFYEAKKKYFILANNKKVESFDDADSIKVDKMSIKDSLFVRFLNKQQNNDLLFTIQEKCALFVGTALVNKKFAQLNKERVNAFLFYFKEKEVEKRVIINSGKSAIPHNGFSYYKIEYKGEFPESLNKAYIEMNEVNDHVRRRIFDKKSH